MSAGDIRVGLACGRSGCLCASPRSSTTHCPAHADRRPSFSVLAVGATVLVHCHAGCTQDAVIAALRTRGLWSKAPAGFRPRSPEEDARSEVLWRERRRLERLAPWFAKFREADEDRWIDQTIAAARQRATELGDCPEAWDLLEAAADLERLTWNATP